MSIKRTIITTVVALALVAVVVPAGAQGVTVQDLMTQIAALQAQLQSLSGSTTTASGTGACAGVTFTRNLTVGSTGTDVKCLQQILNVSPMSGYFGPLTLAAVRAYQTEKGFVPANQVGPLTRAALNTSLAGTTTTTTTGLPTGCTSTSGFSPTTGVSCSTGTSTTTPGAVGFIDAGTIAASPASNSNITATSNVPVLGVNVKAINSNMTVNSLKVQLTTYKGTSASGTAEHPSTSVQKLYVYDGSTLLGSYGVDTNSVYKTSAGLYYVILSGFNFNIPANTTKVLTVTADFAPALETSRYIVVNLYATDSVGATDGTGATRTSGVTTSRTYTVTYSTVGTSTLTGTANTSTPVATSVMIDTTNGTTDVPMLTFNAKSTTGASVLTDLVFGVVATDAGMFNKVTSIKLYDGSTLLGSVTPVVTSGGTGTATFSDLTINIAKDVTKTLTVKADIADMVAGTDTTNGDTVYVTITPSSQFTFTTPNLSTGTPVGSIITGKTMHFYDGEATTFSLVSATAAYAADAVTTSTGYTNGVITLKVHSAGGTTTKPVSADFTVTAYNNGSSVGTATSKAITVTPDENISDGTDATVVISVSESIGDSGTGFINFAITNIQWYITDGTTAIDENTQTWGLTDFKTPTAAAQ